MSKRERERAREREERRERERESERERERKRKREREDLLIEGLVQPCVDYCVLKWAIHRFGTPNHAQTNHTGCKKQFYF